MKSYLLNLIPVSPPILCNTWKHHLRFLTAQLQMAVENGEDVLKQNMYKIGHNVLDLYTGNLTPLEVSEKVFLALRLKNVAEARAYHTWLAQHTKGYVNIQVDDTSLWTLLPGRGDHYVHIHPARYSPHSLRVKALTLKTALWLSFELLKNPETQLALDFINTIREKKLQASPVKSLSTADNLTDLVKLILSNL